MSRPYAAIGVDIQIIVSAGFDGGGQQSQPGGTFTAVGFGGGVDAVETAPAAILLESAIDHPLLAGFGRGISRRGSDFRRGRDGRGCRFGGRCGRRGGSWRAVHRFRQIHRRSHRHLGGAGHILVIHQIHLIGLAVISGIAIPGMRILFLRILEEILDQQDGWIAVFPETAMIAESGCGFLLALDHSADVVQLIGGLQMITQQHVGLARAGVKLHHAIPITVIPDHIEIDGRDHIGILFGQRFHVGSGAPIAHLLSREPHQTDGVFETHIFEKLRHRQQRGTARAVIIGPGRCLWRLLDGIGDGIEMPHQKDKPVRIDLAGDIHHDIPPDLAIGRFVGEIGRLVAHRLQLFEDILLGQTPVGGMSITGAQFHRLVTDLDLDFPAQSAIPGLDIFGPQLPHFFGDDRVRFGGRRPDLHRAAHRADRLIQREQTQAHQRQLFCALLAGLNQNVGVPMPDHLTVRTQIGQTDVGRIPGVVLDKIELTAAGLQSADLRDNDAIIRRALHKTIILRSLRQHPILTIQRQGDQWHTGQGLNLHLIRIIRNLRQIQDTRFIFLGHGGDSHDQKHHRDDDHDG